MPSSDRTDRYTRILAQQNRPNEDVLDRVYSKYAGSNPFLPVTHFVDHATMGAEALVGLGLGAEVDRWAAGQPLRAYVAPAKGIAIETDWTSALGRQECHGDWLVHLEGELGGPRFEDVVARWVPRFAHEVGAWLFHGLIRTAHAVRALEQRDTPARRRELARGLALWAIGVKTPPPPAPPEVDAPEAVADAVVVAEIAGFAKAGAAAFINDPSFPNIHRLTGPMAYLLVVPHLDVRAHRIALRSFAKTHARALARFPETERTAFAEPIPALDDGQLARLVAQSDAHPIKLTEAALRGYAITDDEIFLRAAGRMQHSSTFGRIFRTAKALVKGAIPVSSTSQGKERRA